MNTPKNVFKQSLSAGNQQYGFWMSLCNPISAELCGQCGYDWLLTDAEHAPNDINSIYIQLLAVENTPSHPVVRIAEGNTALIKQMLDIGAQTLLVPMVETREQAEMLVAAIHYPPQGMRGVGTALARAARWNNVKDYFTNASNEICLLVQIESVTAVDNLDAILSVRGIDGVFIGPSDLAASMGHLGNSSHPEVVAAVESSIKKIKSSGKYPGILVTQKSLAKKYEQLGAQFIALGVDTLALADSAKKILSGHLD